MTKEREALKLALEALEDYRIGCQTKYDANKAITAIKEALAQPEQEPYWERVARIKEEMLMVSYEENKLLKEALAQPEPWEKFCDSNCVWTDHHPDCKLAEQEPVAWKTDDVELYVREDKFGFYNIPLYTHPPQRKPLTDEDIKEIRTAFVEYIKNGQDEYAAFDYAFDEYKAAHQIRGEA